jgi:hypothetical protein
VPLQPDFHFSSSSLQDYVDCPYRFELRYIKRLKWPAIQSEPVIEQEKRIDLGNRFHLMVQRSIIGVPDQVIDPELKPDIFRWWASFQDSNLLAMLPKKRRAEISLSSEVNHSRLLAKYDLLALDPGRKAVILDWKTSMVRPSRSSLLSRLQSFIYPYLLVEAGTHLNDSLPLHPDQIEMVYWFPDFPEEPERIQYSDESHQKNKKYLEDLLSEIKNRRDGSFLMTIKENKCSYCNYRSFCNRGTGAGDWDGEETPSEVSLNDLDFEQISESEH